VNDHNPAELAGWGPTIVGVWEVHDLKPEQTGWFQDF
jgi:hypothetical protein